MKIKEMYGEKVKLSKIAFKHLGLVGFKNNITTHLVKEGFLNKFKKLFFLYRVDTDYTGHFDWLVYCGTPYKTQGYIDAILHAADSQNKNVLKIHGLGLTYDDFGIKKIHVIVSICKLLFSFPFVFILWLATNKNRKFSFLDFSVSYKYVTNAYYFFKSTEISTFHSIVPLRDESLAYYVCAKNLGIQIINYDWGVSLEPFPKEMRKEPLLLKSLKYGGWKSERSCIFGNPVNYPVSYNDNYTHAMSEFDTVVILDWGISNIEDRDSCLHNYDITINAIEEIEKKLDKKLKIVIKLRNDSLDDIVFHERLDREVTLIEDGISINEVFSTRKAMAVHKNSTAQYQLSSIKVPQLNIYQLVTAGEFYQNAYNTYFDCKIGFTPSALLDIQIKSINEIEKEMRRDESGIEYSIDKCSQTLVEILKYDLVK